ncbi:conserved hypothetical protein [Vibrio chagasii]|nr:conserved hypothetical protein [Vibrio chagasii]CAH7161994.1 conserved hypothetical protein [Vibrio chagasii]CAH7163450.1 conserved hypothetical protein [Vibrio chagasii]CAH7427897.1 conserved hypothetical protein [Vibrio chagasii]
MNSEVTIVLSALLVISLTLGGYFTFKYLRMRANDLKELNKHNNQDTE